MYYLCPFSILPSCTINQRHYILWAHHILYFLFLILQNFNFELITSDTFQLIKVADFGVARVKAETGVMTAETGTYRWMAPEVIFLNCWLTNCICLQRNGQHFPFSPFDDGTVTVIQNDIIFPN